MPGDFAYRRRAIDLESRLAREATRAVMPTPTWAEHFGTRWGRDVDVVPKGDPGRAAPAMADMASASGASTIFQQATEDNNG